MHFLFAYACFICHTLFRVSAILFALFIDNELLYSMHIGVSALYLHSFSVSLCALCILCIRFLFLLCSVISLFLTVSFYCHIVHEYQRNNNFNCILYCLLMLTMTIYLCAIIYYLAFIAYECSSIDYLTLLCVCIL